MPDELEAFRGEPAKVQQSVDAAVFERRVLMFEFDTHAFAIDAQSIDAVVSWREPTPLPQSDDWLRGVLQERGRIVTVLRHPLGKSQTSSLTPSRVIICSTERGLVGLPTTSTKAVDSVAFEEEPTHGAAVMSNAGVLTFVDVPQLIKSLLDS